MAGLDRTAVSKGCLYVFLLLVVFVFSNILISSLLFIFKVSISPLQPGLAVLSTALVGVLLMRKYNRRILIGVVGVVVACIASSVYLTTITSDDTIDTHGYHQTAVGAMRYGWNPVYEAIGDFNKSGKSPVRLQNSYYEKWDNHYPKAHWIFGANIYSVTGKIETGRSMVIIVMLALFFLTLHYTLLRFNPGLSFLISFIVALNPISVMQLFSYYNDGMLGNLLLMTILMFMMLLDRKYVSFGWTHYSVIIMVLVIMANLKFTGPIYGAIYCFAYFGFIIISKAHRQEKSKALLISGTLAVILAVFVVGLSVYPKNFVTTGSPLYPLIGGGSEADIITPNEPYEFHDMSNISKFLVSNFSETDNISESSGRNPELKVPLTFDMDELSYLSSVDPRIAGYGVWFGAALLLSAGWLIYQSVRLAAKKEWNYLWLMALPIIPTIFIVLVLSESWWARYVPQLFLIPAVALGSMLLMKRKNLANILLFILLFNTILILNLQIAGQKAGMKYRASEEKAVDALLENGKYTPKLYLGDFGGLAYRYHEKYGEVIILAEERDGEPSENYLKLAKDIIVYK
jgi:hypothetical protein